MGNRQLVGEAGRPTLRACLKRRSVVTKCHVARIISTALSLWERESYRSRPRDQCFSDTLSEVIRADATPAIPRVDTEKAVSTDAVAIPSRTVVISVMLPRRGAMTNSFAQALVRRSDRVVVASACVAVFIIAGCGSNEGTGEPGLGDDGGLGGSQHDHQLQPGHR